MNFSVVCIEGIFSNVYDIHIVPKQIWNWTKHYWFICIVFKHLRCTKLGKTQSAEKCLSWSTFLWACLQIREYKIFAFLRWLSAVRERLLSGTDLSKAKGYPGQRWVSFTVAFSFQRFACDHCFVFRKVESWRKSRFYKLEIIYKSFNNVFRFLLKAR